MNRKNSVFTAIFTFLTAFFLFCAATFWVLFSVGGVKGVSFIALKSGFCEKTALEAGEKLNSIARAGGFEEGFFDGVVTEKRVSENLFPFINSAFSEEGFNPNDRPIREEISRRVFAEAEEKMPGCSIETIRILNQTVDLCTKEAVSGFAPSIIRHLCAFSGRFREAFLTAALIFSALFLSSVLILKKSAKSLKTALISASLMLGVAPLLGLIFIREERLGIASVAMRDFLIYFVFFILSFLVLAAVIVLILALFIRKKDPASS